MTMGPVRPNAWVCLVAAIGSAACGRGGSPPAGVVVVDTSGVSVVTNAAELMASVPVWTLAAEPDLEVGSDGSAETALAKVRDILPL